jgi:hypothetical protein
MTIPSNEGDRSIAMYFQLRYIATDFEFGDAQISLSDPVRKIDVLLRKRVPEDALPNPLEADDGIVSVLCERAIAERLQREAISSGQLSMKKKAVSDVFDDMRNHMLRTMRLIRWRTNSHGGPNPIRAAIWDGFKWSPDKIEWKQVADYLSFKVEQSYSGPEWSTEAAQFIKAEISGDLDEPLGHELLREAWTNRDANPRSSIVLAVAAAEVGFKQFASRAFPDTAWILENLPSPPLVKMLTDLFPWTKLKLQIEDRKPIPDSITVILKKAVLLRNEIVHRRVENLNDDTVLSVLTAVRDLLYSLDLLENQTWARSYLSYEPKDSVTLRARYHERKSNG